MFTPISESIAVVGTYNQSKFHPRKFKWRDRVYPVEQLTFVTELKDGSVRQRIYSVMSGGNAYRLVFNRDTEDWQLAEVWCE
jgi:hypothetical protein